MRARRFVLLAFLLTFLTSLYLTAVHPPVYAAKSWDRLQGNRLFPDQFCRDGALLSFASQFGSPHQIGMFQSSNTARPDLNDTQTERRGGFYGVPLGGASLVLARSPITDQGSSEFLDSVEAMPFLFKTTLPVNTSVIMTLERFYALENPDSANRVIPPPDARVGGTSIFDAGRTTYTVANCFLSKAPDIMQQPVLSVASAAQGFTISVVASGFGPLRFQWYSGAPGDTSRPVAGASSPVLNTNTAGGTNFWVRASTAAGSTDSAGIKLNRAYLPAVVSPPNPAATPVAEQPEAFMANAVYGQADFTGGLPLRGSISTGLTDPSAVAVDAGGGLYVVDSANQRVLYYPASGSAPTRVYGQPDLLSNAPNNDGTGVYGVPSATTLFNPIGVALSSTGVYIVDQSNHRVLYYDGFTDTTADRVYGQPGFTTRTIATPSATTILTPTGVTVDAGGVYIADGGNNRVLYFAGTSTTAMRVYGQTNFTSRLPNQGSIPTDARLNAPAGLTHDGTGLYVADTGNDRVLYFAGTSTTATRVFGQVGFTSGYNPGVGTSATRLKGPWGVAVNGNDLWVSDTSSHRVLRYAKSPGGQAALAVYGQANFLSETANQTPADNTLFMPMGIAANANGLYVADMGNNRVLFYQGNLNTVADQVAGQPNMVSGGPYAQQINGTALNHPNGVAFGNGGVFVADSENNRVLFFPNGSTTATVVYGQANLTSNGINRGAGAFSPNNNTLYAPGGVAVAANGLYVADTGNNRVLFFQGFSDTTADQVYGQSGFTDNFIADPPNAISLSRPFAVAVAADGLYVADTGNNRVLFFSNGSFTADRVYGQPNFSANAPNNDGSLTPPEPVPQPTASRMFLPTGVAVDANGLYVADQYNNRMLYFNGFSDTTADRVYGQPGFTTRVINNDGLGNFRGPRATSLFSPASVVIAANGVYVTDSGNNRVVFYPGTTTSATQVYGQPDIGQMVPNNNGSGGYGRPSAESLSRPWGIAVGGGRVWVADSENHRVVGLPAIP